MNHSDEKAPQEATTPSSLTDPKFEAFTRFCEARRRLFETWAREDAEALSAKEALHKDGQEKE